MISQEMGHSVSGIIPAVTGALQTNTPRDHEEPEDSERGGCEGGVVRNTGSDRSPPSRSPQPPDPEDDREKSRNTEKEKAPETNPRHEAPDAGDDFGTKKRKEITRITRLVKRFAGCSGCSID